MATHYPDTKFASSPTAFLNVLRSVACLMVLTVHSGEFFYIGPHGEVVREHHVWVNNYGSLTRACVPLFVMISGYLLLPIREPASVFYKKRFTRLLIPFLVWSAMYAIVPFLKGEFTTDQLWAGPYLIPVNFAGPAGHLWFVYMFIGIYLFIPIISPWVQTASKRFKQFFLAIWIVTLFFPYIRTQFPEILGEAFWNKFNSAYYFSGYIGYLLLGHYFKAHVQWNKATRATAGLLLVVIGYIITNRVFDYQVGVAQDLPHLELSWSFPTINVAMMATGIFLLFSLIKIKSPTLDKFIADLSGLTYGMYLAHILILIPMFAIIAPLLNNDAMLVIPLLAVTTFLITYVLIKLLSYMPGSKYIVG